VARSRHATSAAVAGRSAGEGRAERVEKLLAGELLDTSRIAYDFDVQNLALVAVGSDAEEAIGDRFRPLGIPSLIVRSEGGAVWGWLGKTEGFEHAELEALVSSTRGADVRLAIGEPAAGLAGWRLTHHQAKAALSVALRGPETAVRYSRVALLATVVRDELLASSLRQLYLEPLEIERDGGEELRQTLRAYFDADRNVSLAGDVIGVSRQAVARRLRAVEERLGRPIASCGPDLELALRLEALESAAAPLSAP